MGNTYMSKGEKSKPIGVRLAVCGARTASDAVRVSVRNMFLPITISMYVEAVIEILSITNF